MAITYQNGSTPGLVNGSGTTVCIAQLGYERSESATAVSYTLGVYIYCVNYGYETSGVLSTSLACSGQTTRNTSGGSCDLSAGGRLKLSPSSGNWTYTFPKTTANYSRTIAFALTSTGSSVHGTSSGSLAVSVPALTSHKVSYNSNGGSGTIDQQTKFYGNNITLSDGTGFTRANHTLTGWNTKADGSGTAYALGATYTENSTTNIILYAQWHMDYIKPTITNATAYRVANSSSSTAADNGIYIYISFSYTGGKQPTDSSYTPPKYTISINGTSKANGTLQASGSWPTTTTAYGSYSTNASHTVTIKLYDNTDTEGTTVTLTVGIPTFPIDLLTNGHNTYMGVMTAARDGTLLSVPSVHVIDAISQNSIQIGNSFVVDFVVEEGQEEVTSSGSSPSNGFGTGYWRWREWNSGKVEIWYNGTVTLNTKSTTSNLYRNVRRITFPNNYALYKCSCIIDGTAGGAWANCGGLFDSTQVHNEPYTIAEVMVYQINTYPADNQTNINLYACGEKTS